MFAGLDPKIMLFSAVIFLILLAVLNSMLYKPMLDFMKSRDENIKADEEKILQNKAEASNNETLVTKILTEARQKAQELRNEELTKAKASSAKIIAELKAQLDEQKQAHQEELALSKEQLKNDLRAQFAGFANSLEIGLKNL